MLDIDQANVSLAQFVRQLWETGQVEVFDAGKPERFFDDREEAWLQLEWLASEEQLSLPGRAPAVSRPSAEWALAQFYRACSFLVHRTQFEAELRQALNSPPPEASSPSVCYSVDLVFRFLPDVHRLAQTASPNDPLVSILERWGQDWPLSSVGMEFAAAQKSADESGEHSQSDERLTITDDAAPQFDLNPWWDDDCLRQLYIDRVLRRSDWSRLTDRRVEEAVRKAIGHFPELAPGVLNKINPGSGFA